MEVLRFRVVYCKLPVSKVVRYQMNGLMDRNNGLLSLTEDYHFRTSPDSLNNALSTRNRQGDWLIWLKG